MNIYPVILCGGSGTRLWPTSRPSRPKQFLPLVGDQSLFQATVQRSLEIADDDHLVIITGHSHSAHVKRELQDYKKATVFLEPEGRNSAPAIAVVVHHIAKRDPDGIAVIMASDHYIPRAQDFKEAVMASLEAAHEGRIVTMGIVPTKATSAYGYIKPGPKNKNTPVTPVDAFVEKPDLKTAQTYMDNGYLWNSGNFIFSAKAMRNALKQYAPEIFIQTKNALDEAQTTEYGIELGPSFRKAPDISIDYAVMEKSDRISVLPTAMAWSDLGAWDAVMEATSKDQDQNSVRGNVIAINTKNTLMHAAKDMTIATIGMENVAVIAEKDAVLVCNLEQSQSVKSVLNALKEQSTATSKSARPTPDKSLSDYHRELKQWLFTRALPIWASLGTDHEGWGFYESISQDGKGLNLPRRARVQARQIHSFAAAHDMGWNGPAAYLFDHGLKAIETHYVNADGLMRTLVDADGKSLNEDALLYDQAFYLLALTHGANHSICHEYEQNHEARALKILDQIENHYQHDQGGFREHAAHQFQSNPHMHLFEACLGWMSKGNSPRWRHCAQMIAELVITKMIDSDKGFIQEFFTPAWTPIENENNSDANKTYKDDIHIVQPGHQFEWAWLLTRWSALTSDQSILPIARKLYENGNHGIVASRQVALDDLNDKMQPITDQARLWPQTERLKASLILADCADSSEKERYHQDALHSAETLSRYFDTPIEGLWWDKNLANDSFVDEPASASSLYHIIEAIGQTDESLNKSSRS